MNHMQVNTRTFLPSTKYTRCKTHLYKLTHLALLASGLKTSLESHQIFNDSQCRGRRCYQRGPGSEAPYPEGTHRGLGRGEVRAVAALEALDGAGPGFSVKATEMETEAKSFDAALWAELSPRVRLRF